MNGFIQLIDDMIWLFVSSRVHNWTLDWKFASDSVHSQSVVQHCVIQQIATSLIKSSHAIGKVIKETIKASVRDAAFLQLVFWLAEMIFQFLNTASSYLRFPDCFSMGRLSFPDFAYFLKGVLGTMENWRWRVFRSFLLICVEPRILNLFLGKLVVGNRRNWFKVSCVVIVGWAGGNERQG